MSSGEKSDASLATSLLSFAETLKTYYDALISSGFDEDTALDIMLHFQWLLFMSKAGDNNEQGM